MMPDGVDHHTPHTLAGTYAGAAAAKISGGTAGLVSHGPVVSPHETRFRLWAPRQQQVYLSVPGRGGKMPLQQVQPGYFEAVIPRLPEGTDYCFQFEDGRSRPDPASHFQPWGVHGESRTVDHQSFPWTDGGWRGVPLQDYVLYELHVGTFSAQSTFEAIIERLTYLRDLGITAIELMPVAEFPGRRNWGYDGVSLYAPHAGYGGPTGLKRLVNAAHSLGLAVVLDVVYNHLGPEGNYLGEFGPYFTSRYRTPWGDAINFDGPESGPVRSFFIDNALHWITNYHIDALRLDAVHAIHDQGELHFLADLAGTVETTAHALGRRVHLIAESDLNDPRLLRSRSQGGYGLSAQWNDDFHHSLHSILTGNRDGYLADFGSYKDLAKAMTHGFVFDGQYSSYRERCHGSPSASCSGEQFVVFLQNHDQIANACRGERISGLCAWEAQKLAQAIVLLAPNIPMLFMGQEFASTAPFHYFTSHTDADLGAAVTDGRRREYGEFFQHTEFPNPQSPRTFEICQLTLDGTGNQQQAQMLRLTRDLLTLRWQHECLRNCRKDLTTVLQSEPEGWMVVVRSGVESAPAALFLNFSESLKAIPLEAFPDGLRLALWTGAACYGGDERHATPALIPPGTTTLTLAPHTAAIYLTMPHSYDYQSYS